MHIEDAPAPVETREDETDVLTDPSSASPDEPGTDAAGPDSPSAAESGTPEPQPAADVPSGAQAADGAAAPPPAEAPSAPEPVPTTPWSFRVDGQTVELPGVHVAPDGEIRGLTVDLFRRNLQANYLGDRRAWQREREQLRTEIQARSPENHPDVVRARLFSDEILRILDLDLDARDEALDKLKRELPLYQERARAEAAERRARTYETRQEQETRQAAFAATVPVLKEGLSDYLERALKHEKLADAGLDRAEIEEALLRQFGPRGLFDIGSEEAKRAPDLDTPIGPVRLQTQVIDGYLLSMAAIARRGRDRIEAAERRAAEALAAAEAAKKNAQALAPETSAPPIVPASGAPTGSDTARPWRDPSKSPEERQKLFADYMARQGVPI